MNEDPDRMGRALPTLTCTDVVVLEHSRCPTCIRGQSVDTQPHDQLVLSCPSPDQPPDVDISSSSNQQLLGYLCESRAIFSYPRSDNDILLVECLIPLRAVVNPYLVSQEYVVVRLFDAEDAPLTVMHVAMIRDCLMGADRESLKNACSRPCRGETLDPGPFSSHA